MLAGYVMNERMSHDRNRGQSQAPEGPLPDPRTGRTDVRDQGEAPHFDWERLSGQLPGMSESDRRAKEARPSRPPGERSLTELLMSMPSGAMVTVTVAK